MSITSVECVTFNDEFNAVLTGQIVMCGLSYTQHYDPANASNAEVISTNLNARCVATANQKVYIIQYCATLNMLRLFLFVADSPTNSTLSVYDWTTRGFSPAASLSRIAPGDTTCAGVWGDKALMLCGGTIDDGTTQLTLCSTYNISADAWTDIGPLPVGTRHATLCPGAANDVYLIAGWATAAVYKYTGATNGSWTANAQAYPGGQVAGVGCIPSPQEFVQTASSFY